MRKKVIQWLTSGNSKIVFDEIGTYIWCRSKSEGDQMIGEVRGWGAIQNLFRTKNGIDFQKAEQFQDELGKFIAEAIQEKLDRETEK